MGSLRRAVGALAAALALSGAVAACSSGDPEPTFAPPISTTPSVPLTGAPTSAPAEPKPWEVRSDDGAVAFARHWIDVFNAAQAGSGTSRLRGISDASCGTCNRFVNLTDAIYDAGGHISSHGWRLLQAGISPDMPSTQARVETRIQQSKQMVVKAAGERPEPFTGGPINYQFDLTWKRNKWRLQALLIVT